MILNRLFSFLVGRTDFIYYVSQKILFRLGLVIQVIGLAILAVLYPLESPFFTIGIMLFEIGVLFSSLPFLGSSSWLDKAVCFLTVIGILVQFLGFYAPEEYAGLIIISGVGLISAAAAVITGNALYSLKLNRGLFVLVIFFPVMPLINILFNVNHVLNAAVLSSLFLLLLFLTGKTLRQLHRRNPRN